MPTKFDGQDGEWFSAEEVTAAKNKAAQSARSEAEREAKTALTTLEAQVKDLTAKLTDTETTATTATAKLEEKIALLEQRNATAEAAASKATRDSLLLTEFLARDVPVSAAKRLTALVPVDADISTPEALESVIGPLQADLKPLFTKPSVSADEAPTTKPAAQLPPNGTGGSPAPVGSLTRQDLEAMKPEETLAALQAGRLNTLIQGR